MPTGHEADGPDARTAVICLSSGNGGMELDAVRIARLLSPATDVVLIVRRHGHLDRARAPLLDGSGIAMETVAFRFHYSPRMALEVRRILRRHAVANVIYLGSSELKSLRLAFLGLPIKLVVRHGTTKHRSKQDPFHRWVYKRVHSHVVISRHLAANVAAIYPLRSQTDVQLIYPSVAMSSTAYYRPPGPVVRIVHVGRICRGKGQDAAIRACAHLASSGIDFELVLVGDAQGAEAKSFIGLASQLNLVAKVRWAGHVDDVHPYLVASDIFLFPSLGEGFGNALAEALCTGLVPVVYDNTALGEIMRLGFYGHLVPHGNERELARTLLGVCIRIEKEKLRAFDNVARAREIFSPERERREYLRLLAAASGSRFVH